MEFNASRSTKILIADENAQTRNGIKDELMRAGYRNVEEAAKLYEKYCNQTNDN